jgi:hypothetical protein
MVGHGWKGDGGRGGDGEMGETGKIGFLINLTFADVDNERIPGQRICHSEDAICF